MQTNIQSPYQQSDFADVEQNVNRLVQTGEIDNYDERMVLAKVQQMNERQLRTVINAFNQGLGDSIGVDPSSKAQFVNYLKQLLATRQRRQASMQGNNGYSYGRTNNINRRRF